ncbi:MAG: DHH family phosphoesterase [Euryarchaeota archaeon]|nr:DHH family phosphoesterase [Euryarchaeota archaeon]
MDGMWRAAKAAAELVRSHRGKTVRIVTHIDADALSAAGIAASCLQRAGVEYNVDYCKSLDRATLERIRSDGAALTWYTDLGSAVHHELGAGDKIITDHHEVHVATGALSFPHVNPHLHGIPEGDSISGAGCAYLVASAFDSSNADLAGTAVVGALGDLQDHATGRLTGLNRKILADGEAHGVLRAREDIRFFGRSSRPLPKFLRYADPPIPSIEDSEDAAVEFLVNQRVRVRDARGWRSWYDLDDAERGRILVAVEDEYRRAGRPVDRLRGEAYDLLRETEPELRDAKEFATLLNSTARYDRPEVGLALAMGARGSVVGEARTLLLGHRRSLGGAINFANRQGLTELGPIAYYHAGAEIRDTILGIVTGILLGSGKGGTGRVLVGLADNKAGAIKVSARAPESLVRGGLDLSVSLRGAAEAVGGSGGGHAGAAGATIPTGQEDAFLRAAATRIEAQLGPRGTKSTGL